MMLATIFSDFSVAVGLVGAAIGAFVGLKLIAYDRNLPLITTIGFFALFMWLAQLLIILVSMVLLIGLIVVAIRYRPVIARAMESFAEAAGVQFSLLRPLETFSTRIEEAVDDYLIRRRQIHSLPLESDEIEDILGNLKDRFTEAVIGLSDEFPYLRSQQRRHRPAYQQGPFGRDEDLDSWLSNS